MVNYELEIRKRIVSAEPGLIIEMPIGHMTPEVAQLRAKAFAKTRGIRIAILESTDGIAFKRLTDAEASRQAYPEMGSLEIGGSHLYELPPPLHQRVRMAATAKNRSGLVLLSCSRESGGIRVTRHPLTPDEIQAHGLVAPRARGSKYGLERLETEAEIFLQPTSPVETRAIRVAVSTKAQNAGWQLSCRKLDDGRLHIKRHIDKEKQ